MTKEQKHLWKGNWIDDKELQEKLHNLNEEVSSSLTNAPTLNIIIDTLEKFGKKLSENPELIKGFDSDYSEVANFCRRDFLEKKLLRELGTKDWGDLTRVEFESDLFESWSPLGVLSHITPSNAPALAFLAVVEGLLAGNVNILKLSSRDNDFALKSLEALFTCDETDKIKNSVMALRISSAEKETLSQILNVSDGISVWGGDNAINSISEMAPVGARIIPWGHKISFAYVANEMKTSNELAKLADDCVLMEQQACSSPQVIYFETDSFDEVKEFSKEFSKHLAIASDKVPTIEKDIQEQAELTNVTELAKLDEVWGENFVIEDKNKDWRIIADISSSMKPSPLFRTIWIKPLLPTKLISTLRPFRNYLQTGCLLAEPKRAPMIGNGLIKAGVNRITLAGKMLESYEGEPHDGLYALPRFMRKVRAEFQNLNGIYRLSDFEKTEHIIPDVPVMDKKSFQEKGINEEKVQLKFRSGGSSGKPALSPFSYDDYHAQMQAAAEGLYASGLEPKTDRVINLFFGGGLYGGFISFFTILEDLEVVHFPMSAHDNLDFVIDTIIEQKINTLLGMPSYLVTLLQKGKERFKESGVLEKVFYGGEHFTPKQKTWLKEEFNIDLVRSASYGSVDAGPLGYQCPCCEGAEHHLHQKLHHLEILKIDSDEPVNKNNTEEIGRLVFTSYKREAIDITRYDLGDLGRWAKDCECGRKSPRFELMGRAGDIFRAAGTFINFQKLCNILLHKSNYSGEAQLIITKEDNLDFIQLVMDNSFTEEIDYKKIILENYFELDEVYTKEKTLNFEVNLVDAKSLLRTAGSGKLIRVKDER